MISAEDAGTTEVDERPALARRVLAVLALAKLALHVAVNLTTPYGVHRDEFLYMAMGRHLRLWRMDFPPLIAMLAQAERALLGDSLVAVRAVPALAGAAVLVMAGVMARELGGRRVAQGLAALCVLCAPLFLRSANLFQPVVLDQLAWTVALWALARLVRTEDRRWWLALGAALGVGLLTKFSVGVLGVAVAAAVLLTPWRRALATPWPWLAVLLALAIGSPSLVGQLRLGFPVTAQMGDLRAAQLSRVTPAAFLAGQAMMIGPGVLLALAGLAALLGAAWLRAFRVLGWTCLGAVVLLMAAHGKAYYAGPVYPTLLAAGAVAFERATARATTPMRLARAAAALVVVAFGAVILPLGVPILAPPRMERYARRLGGDAAVRTNTGAVERLPQDFADMLGWPQQAAAVARVYDALPPEDRARAVIIGSNYGEAGALDFYGPRHGLPPAVAPVGSYWFFGPGPLPGEVAIVVARDTTDLTPFFDSVRTAAVLTHPYAVEEERTVLILVCRRPKRTLQQIWPTLAGRN